MSHNKKHNKEIRAKYTFQQKMIDYPDWCYCYELLGLDSDVDYQNDSIIETTEPIDGYPFPASVGFTQNIYRCKRCGKKNTLQIAFA